MVRAASTIHRALGVVHGNANRFRKDKKSPLFADFVIVDEASMIDLSLMRRLVDALPVHARLVLLGDRHQLASVQAGSVLSEICLLMSSEGSRPLVELTQSYRFGDASGIARVARLVREGNAELGRGQRRAERRVGIAEYEHQIG